MVLVGPFILSGLYRGLAVLLVPVLPKAWAARVSLASTESEPRPGTHVPEVQQCLHWTRERSRGTETGKAAGFPGNTRGLSRTGTNFHLCRSVTV